LWPLTVIDGDAKFFLDVQVPRGLYQIEKTLYCECVGFVILFVYLIFFYDDILEGGQDSFYSVIFFVAHKKDNLFLTVAVHSNHSCQASKNPIKKQQKHESITKVSSLMARFH